MKEIEFNNKYGKNEVIANINAAIIENQPISTTFNFRGQADYDWKIESSLFRDNKNLSIDELLEKEKENIEQFKTERTDEIYYPTNKNEEYWNLLMQAQHLSYQTRLIDWTPDYSVALWMAMYNDDDEPQNMDVDGAILMIPNNIQMVLHEDLENINPNKVEQAYLIYPATNWNNKIYQQTGQKRILRQIGKFFTPANKDLNNSMENIAEISDNIIKLKIPKKVKFRLHEDLQKKGFSYSKMYDPKYIK